MQICGAARAISRSSAARALEPEHHALQLRCGRPPFATVNALGSVHDEDEMHCNVLVRHRDRPKLNRIYEELLEGSEGRPRRARRQRDIAEFHVEAADWRHAGRRAAPSIGTPHRGCRISARCCFAPSEGGVVLVPASATMPSLLDHVPARWSYRRVTAEDELKATNYLACPRQPAAGWAYLDAVADVVRRQSHSARRACSPGAPNLLSGPGPEGDV